MNFCVKAARPVFLAAAILWASAPVAFADYPDKTVRIILPLAPGGAMDNLGRSIAQELGKRWKQPVIVENQPGAGGIIAADAVARSAPDGYTLHLTGDSLVTAVTLFADKVTYDPIKSFAPISILATSTTAIVVREQSPIKDLPGLVKLAEERPVTIATPGHGNNNHFALVALQKSVKGTFEHVPYKGAGPAIVALLAAETDAAIVAVPAIAEQARSGSVRVLAVVQNPSKALPGVPTVKEAGVPFDAKTGWFGLLAPAGTPKEVVGEINKAVTEIILSEEFSSRLIKQGYEPVASSSQAFEDRIADDVVKLPPLLNSVGAKVD